MSLPYEFYSIDPGLAKVGGSGWALWEDGLLSTAGVLRNHRDWTTINDRVRGQRDLLVRLPAYQGQIRVCESMVQRYGGLAKKVPPQDLIDLNLLAGALGTVWVTPTVWKGSVSREMEQARTRHALDPAETTVLDSVLAQTIKGMHKEVLSAVGIGLSVLGRTHRKCGWPLKEGK